MATVDSTSHHDSGSTNSQLPNYDPSKSQNILKELSNWPLNEIDSLINSVKTARETDALRGRFPQGLEEVAARIQVVSPTEATTVSPRGATPFAWCSVFQHQLRLSVERIGTFVEGQSAPSICPLDIIVEQWYTRSNYATGLADSDTVSVVVQYNGEKKTAHVSSYDDPARGDFSAVGGSVKSILEAVLQDLGVDGSDTRMPRGAQFLSLLLGDGPAKQALDKSQDPNDPEMYPTLGTSIEENKSIELFDSD